MLPTIFQNKQYDEIMYDLVNPLKTKEISVKDLGNLEEYILTDEQISQEKCTLFVQQINKIISSKIKEFESTLTPEECTTILLDLYQKKGIDLTTLIEWGFHCPCYIGAILNFVSKDLKEEDYMHIYRLISEDISDLLIWVYDLETKGIPIPLTEDKKYLREKYAIEEPLTRKK